MRRQSVLLIAAILWQLFTSGAKGQSVASNTWRQVDSGWAGFIGTIDASQNRVFVGAGIGGNANPADTLGYISGNGGLYRSSDDGEKWTKLNFTDGAAVSPVKMFGSRVLASTFQGLFLSRDNGSTWVNTAKNIFAFSFVVSGPTVIAGTMGIWGGAYRSNDFGESWAQAGTGLPDGEVVSLIAAGGIIFAATCYGTGGGNGVFASTNDGSSWAPANTSFDAYALAVNGEGVLVGTDKGLYSSVDGGKTWDRIDHGFQTDTVTSIAVSGGKIFAGTSHGIYISENGGTSWSSYNEGLGSIWIHALAVSDSFIYAGTYGYGLWKRALNVGAAPGFTVRPRNLAFDVTEVGVTGVDSVYLRNDRTGPLVVDSAMTTTGNFRLTWPAGITTPLTISSSDSQKCYVLFSPSSKGPQSDSARFFHDNSVNPYVLALTGEGSVAPQMKGWVPCAGFNSGFLTVEGSDLFAANIENEIGVYLSTDFGVSWTKKGNTGVSGRPLALACSGSVVLMGTPYGVFVSTDYGAGWHSSNSGLPMGSRYNLVYAFAFEDGKAFVSFSGSDYGVFVSVDNGANWTAGGLREHVPSCLISADSDLFAGTFDGWILLSTNGGSSWTAITTSLGRTAVNSIASIGAHIFAATADSGVFVSHDDGKNWKTGNEGLTSKAISSLAVKGSNVFAATAGGVFLSTDYGSIWSNVTDGMIGSGNIAVCGEFLFAATYESGLWRRALSDLIDKVDDYQVRLPVSYILHQNYPNPFNPSTAISYELSAKGYVTLRVYDVLGREVRTLVNEVEKAGRYEIRFDGSGLASGVYFYRIQAGTYSAVMKMLLVK